MSNSRGSRGSRGGSLKQAFLYLRHAENSRGNSHGSAGGGADRNPLAQVAQVTSLIAQVENTVF
jgi:hypothetical protein